MKRWSSASWLGLGTALAVALLGCARLLPGLAAPERPEPGVSPPLWRADAPAPGRGTLFLLGSVHIGTREMLDLGRSVDQAYAVSDELVVETEVSDVTPQKVATLTQRYGTLPAPSTLHDVVSAETYLRLAAYLARRGLSPSSVERFKPWFVSFVILHLELRAAGYDPELGVDRVLMDQAAGEKPVVGLETIASQLEVMDRLPASIQELMLKDALVRMDRLVADTVELMGAWRRGDEARLIEILFSPLAEFPELEVFYDTVFFQRNETMTARLAAMAGDGKTRLVVVGAGHVVGERGIPARLARRGYRVRRVTGALVDRSTPIGERRVEPRQEPRQPPSGAAPGATQGSFDGLPRFRSRAKKASSRARGPAAMPASISVRSWL